RGQNNPATLLQLKQQRARGHVLELPGGGSPVPPLRQFPADPPATPIGLGRQKALHLGHLITSDAAPLNQFRFVHHPQDGESEGQSPDKNEKTSPARIPRQRKND